MSAEQNLHFAEAGPRLFENGYQPVPILSGSKRPEPDILEWQHYQFKDSDAQKYRNSGTGIICGKCVGVDIDVRDKQIAAWMRATAEELLGPAPARIGAAPKVLLLYAVDGEPFPKIQTAGYRLPTDGLEDKVHKVEVLAAGQQFVAYHVHPDTRLPYRWNGLGEPATIPLSMLPAVTLARLKAFVAEADAELARHGRRVGRLTQAASDDREHASSTSQRADDPAMLRAALEHIPNADLDYDDWVRIGLAVKGALGEDGREVWLAWSARSSKDSPMYSASQWASFNPKLLGAGTIYYHAKDRGWKRPLPPAPSVDLPPVECYEQDARFLVPSVDEQQSRPNETPDPTRDVSLEDFRAYMPQHAYIFTSNGELWPAASVDARLPWPIGANGNPQKPSKWLDANRPVEQMTWAPGEPMVINDHLVSNGGWIERKGCATFNLYRPPAPILGEAREAARWLEHVRAVFPDESDHIVKWLAHRVQKPGEKINHALVLGGNQGIGKDTILEPVKYAVGPWNFNEVSPTHLLGRFNGFIKSVILRISEARDLGDVDRFSFYDHMKVYTAAPPDVLRCDEKNLREHAVLNVCGVILTSNHKQDGIYLPADDRRHFVAWSALTKEEFSASYWNDIWGWYATGGIGHVAAYLAGLDLGGFDPKAPPAKTAAFRDIVDANRAPEDSELADTLDALGNPKAVTLTRLADKAEHTFAAWLQDRKNRRQIPHRLEAAGYVAVRNPSAADGLWKIRDRRQAVYAQRGLAVCDRLAAAASLNGADQWCQ